MLKLEGAIDHPEATCYPEEHDELQWYVLPGAPTMRREPDGKLAFKFVKYRSEKPLENGEIGAALMFMDVQLALTPAQEDTVRAGIAQTLTARRGPGAQAVEPAQITLTRPQWTKGSVDIEVMGDSENIVQKVNHAGTPSMYGQNVTAMSAELTQLGAPIVEAVLSSGGLGGVRVVYTMEFNARMPPIQATGTWFASRFYEFIQDVDFEENFWSEDDFTEKVSETFRNAESRVVKVDPGGQANALIQPVLDRVELAVTAQLDEAVKRNLLDVIPPENRDFSKIREQDFENIKRNVTVNKRSDVTISMTINQVLAVPVAPQANMPSITSLGGVWTDYAIEAPSEDPFFTQLNLPISVNADFDSLPIFSVDVSIDYPPETARTGIETFTFRTADDLHKFVAFTDGGSTDFKYRYVVNYKGESRTFQSPWTDHQGNDLKINIDELGLWTVDVLPGNINFDQVDRAVVTLQHPEIAPGVPPVVRFEIKEGQAEHRIREVLLAPTQPYDGSVTYFMRDGREFVRGFTGERGQRYFVDDPFTANRTLMMRARGDLDTQIRDIGIDARYHDPGNAFTQTTQVTLSKDLPFSEWTFPVIDEQAGTLTCRSVTSFRDGSQIEDEKVVTGSTEFFGTVATQVQVVINPDLFDFTVLKLVNVTLRYVDEANGIDESDSFTFRPDAGPQTWTPPILDRTKKAYTWKATFFLLDGSRRESDSGGPTTEESLFIDLPA